jgi:hypothetical protein
MCRSSWNRAAGASWKSSTRPNAGRHRSPPKRRTFSPPRATASGGEAPRDRFRFSGKLFLLSHPFDNDLGEVASDPRSNAQRPAAMRAAFNFVFQRPVDQSPSDRGQMRCPRLDTSHLVGSPDGQYTSAFAWLEQRGISSAGSLRLSASAKFTCELAVRMLRLRQSQRG